MVVWVEGDGGESRGGGRAIHVSTHVNIVTQDCSFLFTLLYSQPTHTHASGHARTPHIHSPRVLCPPPRPPLPVLPPKMC